MRLRRLRFVLLSLNQGRPGRPSDHNVVLIKMVLPRNRKFKWLKYSYQKYTPDGDVAFGVWILEHDWAEVVGDPSDMAASLGRTLDMAMSVFFPKITRRLWSDQDP